jgi:hypothetical protein
MTWASVSSTKRLVSLPFFDICLSRGCKTDSSAGIFPLLGWDSHDYSVTRLAYGPSRKNKDGVMRYVRSAGQ